MMALTAAASADTGIFSVFDADKNGSIEPKEVYTAYKNMDVSADNKVGTSEFRKVMDGHVRAFCDVRPATKEDLIKMDNEKKMVKS